MTGQIRISSTVIDGNKSERDDKEFTWRGGVNYLFDNGVTPYFSYSESFEPASQDGKDGNMFRTVERQAV